MGDYIEFGSTSSDSINTPGDIALLAEFDNGKPAGIEFDTENVFGGFNKDEGFMIGGRTPSINEFFGIDNELTSTHYAGSKSAIQSNTDFDSKVTISFYPLDITTKTDFMNGEVMSGYYVTASFERTVSVAAIVTASVYFGAPEFAPAVIKFLSSCTMNSCPNIIR